MEARAGVELDDDAAIEAAWDEAIVKAVELAVDEAQSAPGGSPETAAAAAAAETRVPWRYRVTDSE